MSLKSINVIRWINYEKHKNYKIEIFEDDNIEENDNNEEDYDDEDIEGGDIYYDEG